MYYYQIFGYTFRCQHEIRQLYEVSATEDFDAEILLGEMPEEITEEVATATEFPCISCAPERFWMHNLYGILAVYKNGNIYAKSVSDKDTFYLLQYVLGYGIAMYAHLHNRLCIHCGCVSINDKCIIITGDSGAGKSTLTHEFISDGARMLSDDVIAIDYDENHNPIVFPAFPQQKICRDAALEKGYDLNQLLYVDPEKDKYAIMHQDFSPAPCTAHSLFYIQCYDPQDTTNNNPETQQSPLVTIQTDGFQKVNIIADNLYLGCIIPNVGLSAESFQLCVDFIKDCNVYRIKRPTNRNTLAEIKDFIYNAINI